MSVHFAVYDCTYSVACVASVPVQAERSIGRREGIFAFGTCGKWDESKKYPLPSSFLLSPHFLRVPNVKTPSCGLIFLSARTGTLATQATYSVAFIQRGGRGEIAVSYEIGT